MFEELKTELITKLLKEQRGILLPTIKEQLSLDGYILDLDALPVSPLPFKDLFIRWLVSVNQQRIQNSQPVLCTYELVMRCPLWRVVACPIRKLTLTKEGMFNKPTASKGTLGTMPTRSINRQSSRSR